ncbi:MAG: hypothetical protein DRI84_07730 [Bacteroidetes bacterium]|nr:MAG: hypothetical protein DRI84_07730 [Bacteroidota bacterium]
MDDKGKLSRNRIFYFFLVVTFLVSCGSHSEQRQESQIHVVKSDSVKKVISILTSNCGVNKFFISIDSLYVAPDTSVYMFILENQKSIIEILSDTIDINEEDELTPFPNIVLLSKSQYVELKLLFYPGNTKGAFSKFILKKVNHPNSKAIETGIDDKQFKLSHGAYIGMRESEFLGKYGLSEENIVRSDSIVKVFGFSIIDFENNNFLMRYNMPIYKAEYVFLEEELIEVNFGFEYP